MSISVDNIGVGDVISAPFQRPYGSGWPVLTVPLRLKWRGKQYGSVESMTLTA